MLAVSVANTDYSIAKQLEIKKGMVFADDLSALEWTLKKSNSTRDDKEAGGLGLYLLRKYIYELGGSAIILSGNSYIELDNRCFEPKAENFIIYKTRTVLKEEYKGTIITLFIPYVVKKVELKENDDIITISLWDFLGE